MTANTGLATLIVAVLDKAAEGSSMGTDDLNKDEHEVLTYAIGMNTRYSSLKQGLDYATAARQAKIGIINQILDDKAHRSTRPHT